MKMDLERKMEAALISRLQQHPELAGMNFKPTNSELPAQNGDVRVTAKRGGENPPYSGIFNLDIEIEIRLRMDKRAAALASHLAHRKALEEVLSTPYRQLAREITAAHPEFHCYEFLVTSKEDNPEEDAHRCLYGCSAIAMSASFQTAEKLNPH